MAGSAGAARHAGAPGAGAGGAPRSSGSGGSTSAGTSNGGAPPEAAVRVAAAPAAARSVAPVAPPITPEVTPCATNVLSKCTGTPLACHFGGDPGNYEVTVQLGGAGKTEVEAEYYRRMLTQTTVAGDAKWFSFVTNVRVYEGEPLRPDQDGTTSKGIPGLDIYFRGRTRSR